MSDIRFGQGEGFDQAWDEQQAQNVRVVRGNPTFIDEADRVSEPVRSKAQERREEILNDAEDLLRRGRDLIVEGLEMFGVLDAPQHPNLPVLVGQQLEQVIEYRRLHR